MASAANTHALVVGIAEYDAGATWQLYAPLADAARTVVWLLRRHVPPHQIHLFLSPTPPSVHQLLASVSDGPLPAGADDVTAGGATEHEVVAALRGPLRAATGELLVVFWAGHGVSDEDRDQRLFFADATDDDRRNLNVRNLLASMRSSYFAGFPQQIVCIDACASRFDGRARAMTLPANELAVLADVGSRTQSCLTAATRGQTALESKRQRKGLFTRELIAQLEADTSAQWPPDMRAVAVKLRSVFATLSRELPSEQLPALWTYDDDVGSIPWRPPAEISTRPPRPGREVTRRVDRVVQARAFRSFFNEGLQRHRRRPHAVILFGDRGEAHHSLVERVVTDCIQTIARQSHGAPVRPPIQQLPWPTSGTDLEDQKDQLREALLTVGTETPESGDLSCAALLRNPALQGHGVVVYHHYWTVTGWSETDERLLQWYLTSYWDDAPAEERTPHAVIFLKIVCADEMSRVNLGSMLRLSLTPKRQLKAALERLASPPHAGCRRIVLDELEPVPFAALEAWFYEVAVEKWLSEREANAAAARIFAGPDGRPRKCVPMADIEDALEDLIEPPTEQRAS